MTKNKQLERGQAFARYCRGLGLKDVDIADALGLESAQTLQNWKKRGVPAKRAIQVARFLGCQPSEISDAIISSTAAEELAGLAIKKRQIKDAVNNIIDSVDDPRVLDLLAEQVSAVERLASKPK